MSEHKHSSTRYWKRTEPDKKVVYFTTESNAGHSRAEGDPRAEETTREDYETYVPVEARSKPYDATHGEPAAKPAKPLEDQPASSAPSPEQVIGQYQQQSVLTMLTLHKEISGKLMEAPLTHAERIFILEAIKHEFLSNLMAPVQVAGVRRPS